MFYDSIVAALRQGELTPEGGALPTTLNALLELLPGEQPPAARDREMTDWSFENDLKYAAFLDVWRTKMVSVATKAPRPRAIAAPLHQAVTQLQAVQTGGGKKADLDHAVSVFLNVYALSQYALRLPTIERNLPRQLPQGIALDERKVMLGNNAKGTYVGLVRRQAAKSD